MMYITADTLYGYIDSRKKFLKQVFQAFPGKYKSKSTELDRLKGFITTSANSYWTSTEDDLPEKSGDYLCRTYSGLTTVLSYSDKYGMFNCADFLSIEEARSVAIDVKCWACFPPPPVDITTKQEG